MKTQLDPEVEKRFDDVFDDGLVEEFYNEDWAKKRQDKWIWVGKTGAVKDFLAQEINAAILKERERILGVMKLEEERKWDDADHCSCLRYVIDVIEHPEADRKVTTSKPE